MVLGGASEKGAQLDEYGVASVQRMAASAVRREDAPTRVEPHDAHCLGIEQTDEGGSTSTGNVRRLLHPYDLADVREEMPDDTERCRVPPAPVHRVMDDPGDARASGRVEAYVDGVAATVPDSSTLAIGPRK